MIPPAGGRDDYVGAVPRGRPRAALRAAWTPSSPFEFRHLGDNSVTEAFAFLFDRLVEDPEWLRRMLGVEDADGGWLGHARARELVLPAPVRGQARRTSSSCTAAAAARRRCPRATRALLARGRRDARGRPRAPGRRRPGLLRRGLPASVGARGHAARASASSASGRRGSPSREAGTCCARCGAGPAARRRRSCSSELTGAELDFGCWRIPGRRRRPGLRVVASRAHARSPSAPTCGWRDGARSRAPCAAPPAVRSFRRSAICAAVRSS